MHPPGMAAFAICAALFILISGCVNVKVVDDANGSAQQAAPILPSPPTPPANAPNFSGGLPPSSNLGGGNLSALLSLAKYMIAGGGANASLTNKSGIDASQLALLQKMMAGNNGTGGYGSLNSQQLALVQQMMAGMGGGAGASGVGGYGSLSPQQLASIQQMMAGGNGNGASTGGMSAEQLAALQQMVAGGEEDGYGAQNQQPQNSQPSNDAMKVSPPNADVNVTYFYKPNCPYCTQVAPLISRMKQAFGSYNWKEVDVGTAAGYAQFDAAIRRLSLSNSYYVVPFVAVNDRALVGISEINETLPSVLAGLS